MEKEFNSEVCHEKHKAQDERHLTLREEVTQMGAKTDKHLEKIYGRMDELGKELLKRLPPWVTVIISVLTACVGALAGLYAASLKNVEVYANALKMIGGK